jgi:hypothetical protein
VIAAVIAGTLTIVVALGTAGLVALSQCDGPDDDW